jgi:8-oxo-dGTP pyrophosphatase MutT (NUDIX family)
MTSIDAASSPVKAAGVILMAPSGRVLLLHRVDDGTWSWPGGGIKDGETPEEAAERETYEELGYWCGKLEGPVLRRVKDGVDYTTFMARADLEFTPMRLNHEHDQWMWCDPRAVLRGEGPDEQALGAINERLDELGVRA